MTLLANEEKDGGQLRDAQGRRQLVLRGRGQARSITDVPQGGTIYDSEGREQVVIYDADSRSLHKVYVWDVTAGTSTTAGALGNTTTDDYAAAQAVIDAASLAPHGAVVYFPLGRYLLSQTLTVSANGVFIIGAGIGNRTTRGTVLLPSSTFTGTYAVNFTGTAGQPLVGSIMRDICIDGGNTTTLVSGYPTTGTVSGVRWHVENGHMDQVHVLRFGVDLLYVEGDGSVGFNFFYNLRLGQAGRDGIVYTPSGSDSILVGSVVNFTTRYGVNMGAAANQIVGCNIALNKGWCVFVDGQQTKISGGTKIRSSNGGVWVNDGNGFQIAAVTFRGCSTDVDGAVDSIFISPLTTCRGGLIDAVEFSCDTANRPRHCINVNSANMRGLSIGTITTGYQGAAASAYTGSLVVDGGTQTLRQGALQKTSTWDPAATAAAQGARVTQTVAVPGAAVGDVVQVAHSGLIAADAVSLDGQVFVADQVEVRLTNTTAASVNVASGTTTVRVLKPQGVTP